jgi:hypothetical protein
VCEEKTGRSKTSSKKGCFLVSSSKIPMGLKQKVGARKKNKAQRTMVGCSKIGPMGLKQKVGRPQAFENSSVGFKK